MLPDRAARAPDRAAMVKALADLLVACGAELDLETRGTPERVAKAFAEDLLDGYLRDPVETLRRSLVTPPLKRGGGSASPAGGGGGHPRRARLHAGARAQAPAEPRHRRGVGRGLREGRRAARLARPPRRGMSSLKGQVCVVTGASRGI